MEENPCIKNKKPIVREKECDGKEGMISMEPIQEGYCVNQVCFDKKEIQGLRLTHLPYVPKEGESPPTGPSPIPRNFKDPIGSGIITEADIVAAGIQSPTKDTYDKDYEDRKEDYIKYKKQKYYPISTSLDKSPKSLNSSRRKYFFKKTRNYRNAKDTIPLRTSNKLNHIKLDEPTVEFRREYEKSRYRRRAVDSILLKKTRNRRGGPMDSILLKKTRHRRRAMDSILP